MCSQALQSFPHSCNALHACLLHPTSFKVTLRWNPLCDCFLDVAFLLGDLSHSRSAAAASDNSEENAFLKGMNMVGRFGKWYQKINAGKAA